MTSITISLLVLIAGIPPEQMGNVVADRLAALDKLEIEMTLERYNVPLSASPLDRNAWTPIPGPEGGFRHQITVVRPCALGVMLTDDEGYTPTRYAANENGLVTQRLAPLENGRTFFAESNYITHSLLTTAPVLDALDIHIADSSIPLFNLRRIFEETEVALVRTVGPVSTYVASQLMNDTTQHYEFDLSEQGTPLRMKIILEWTMPDGRPAQAVREQFTLATMAVNGAELPSEVAFVPDPPVAAGLDYTTVTLVRITSATVRPELTAESVALAPEYRNSIVTTWDYFSEERISTLEYDEDGNQVALTRVEESEARQAVRAATPVTSGLVGLGVAVSLILATRRRP
ncbi:MAG: hypothetical protein ABIG44_06035 [Planctomycetota bacterium]